MTNDRNRERELAELERLLEAFGEDPRRWPTGSGKRFRDEARQHDGAAEQLLAEARALDALLNCAKPIVPHRDEALLDKITGAVMGQPKGDVVRPLPRRVAPLGGQRKSVIREHATAFSALAAALVLGVLAGTSSALQPVAEAVAVATVGGGEMQQLAVASGNDAGLDENML